jgi:hypothetical protein
MVVMGSDGETGRTDGRTGAPVMPWLGGVIVVVVVVPDPFAFVPLRSNVSIWDGPCISARGVTAPQLT